jgi:hypothetical protein
MGYTLSMEFLIILIVVIAVGGASTIYLILRSPEVMTQIESDLVSSENNSGLSVKDGFKFGFGFGFGIFCASLIVGLISILLFGTTVLSVFNTF